MRIQYKKLLISILIPLSVGGLATFLTRNQMNLYEVVNLPLLAPPSILFPVVWTILYGLMGISFYLVWTTNHQTMKTDAYVSYGLQLIFNFFWPILFFNGRLYWISFVWLVLLWVAIINNVVMFKRINRCAGYLLLPYVVWVTFAGYLNFSIYLLN